MTRKLLDFINEILDAPKIILVFCLGKYFKVRKYMPQDMNDGDFFLWVPRGFTLQNMEILGYLWELPPLPNCDQETLYEFGEFRLYYCTKEIYQETVLQPQLWKQE